MSKYNGFNCPECGAELEPVFFIEEEEKENWYGGKFYGYSKTGRWRKAVDYLVCPCCGNKECVDSSLDGPWMDERVPKEEPFI